MIQDLNLFFEMNVNLTSWHIQEEIFSANLVNKEIFKQIVEIGFFAIMMKQGMLIILLLQLYVSGTC